MKKLIALLLTALLLPLTACGDTGAGTQVRAPQKQEENTLQNQETQNMAKRNWMLWTYLTTLSPTLRP